MDGLPQGVGVPRGPRPRREVDAGGPETGRLRGRGDGEPLAGAGSGLGGVSGDLHVVLLVGWDCRRQMRSLRLGARRARDELDRRGPRFRADHRLDVARVPAVLLTVGGVDESDVPIDAPGADASFVAVPSGAVPASGATAPGSHVQVVADADDPDRHRRPQAPVAPPRREPQLCGRPDLLELVARPFAHVQTSTMTHFAAGGEAPYGRSSVLIA